MRTYQKTIPPTAVKITTLLLFAFISFPALSQWNVSDFVPAGTVDEVDYPAENTAYITGDFGLVYKSTDGGISWNQIHDFGPFSSLSDPNFINADTGFVSANGGVYRTLDGGDSWTSISANWMQQTGISVSRIKITGEKLFASYADNDTTYILRSNSYGTNWTTLFWNYEVNAQPYKFSFVDSLNGYFINPNELGQVLKTNDGGLSFSDTLVITNGPIVLQRRYDFKDLENGYLYGSTGSQSSPTRTWNTGTFYLPINLDGFGVLPILDLDFNTSKLFASTLYGKIFYSQNDGQNWVEQPVPVSSQITSIAFFNENKGIAVSGNKVLYTNNGGLSGINDLTNESPVVNLYPNPASGLITIENAGIPILKITVIDSNGKIVDSINSPSSRYNFNSLSSGTYLFQIETEKGLLLKKVVIK